MKLKVVVHDVELTNMLADKIEGLTNADWKKLVAELIRLNPNIGKLEDSYTVHIFMPDIKDGKFYIGNLTTIELDNETDFNADMFVCFDPKEESDEHGCKATVRRFLCLVPQYREVIMLRLKKAESIKLKRIRKETKAAIDDLDIPFISVAVDV